MNDVTRILFAIEKGDPSAADQLVPLVYDELRKLAAQKLAQEKPGQTLEATALVHEVYLRLVDSYLPPLDVCPRLAVQPQDVRRKHQAQIDVLKTEGQRHSCLCELNVIEQVVNVSQTSVVRDAWARGQALAVHGWVYALSDGLLELP